MPKIRDAKVLMGNDKLEERKGDITLRAVAYEWIWI
jgi:hypothetical protein